MWQGLPLVAPLFTFMPEANRALGEIADFIVAHTAPRAVAPAIEGNPSVALAVRPEMRQAGNAS